MEKEEDEGAVLNWMLVYQNKVEGLISLLNQRSQETHIYKKVKSEEERATQDFYFYFTSFK